MKPKYSAFTLIEIMMVSAVLLTISGLIIGNYFTSQKYARDAKRRTDLETLKQTLEIYKSTVTPPSYPVTAGGKAENLRPVLVPDYLSLDAFPQDPSSDQGLYYFASVSSQTFSLCAYLEKKQPTDPDCPTGTPSCGGGKNCNYGITQPLP